MTPTAERPSPRLTPGRARRESKRARRLRTEQILARLHEEYPDSRCALVHQDALELLVATILSAQCTDKRVNMVTPALFERYPTAPATTPSADCAELEEMIRSTGFFRNKARSLKGLGQALVAEHDGEVPRTHAELSRCQGSDARRPTSFSATPSASTRASSSTPMSGASRRRLGSDREQGRRQGRARPDRARAGRASGRCGRIC